MCWNACECGVVLKCWRGLDSLGSVGDVWRAGDALSVGFWWIVGIVRGVGRACVCVRGGGRVWECVVVRGVCGMRAGGCRNVWECVVVCVKVGRVGNVCGRCGACGNVCECW